MSNAISSFGTLFQMSDMGVPVWSTIAEVRDIGGPSLQQATAEVTNQLSTGRYREFISTVKDGGEITFEIGFIPDDATHDVTTGLLSVFESGLINDFKIIFPDTAVTTWTLSGLVTGFELSEPVDGDLTASVTIKISGEPTLT